MFTMAQQITQHLHLAILKPDIQPIIL
jgi:hypothetical protein